MVRVASLRGPLSADSVTRGRGRRCDNGVGLTRRYSFDLVTHGFERVAEQDFPVHYALWHSVGRCRESTCACLDSSGDGDAGAVTCTPRGAGSISDS